MAEKLKPEEKSALKNYTGSGYHEINGQMRKCPPDYECVKGELRDKLDRIESALKKAGKLKEPTTVYRGIDVKPAVLQNMLKLAGKLEGTEREYYMPCLTSTSASQSFASSWGGDLLFHIVAKTGLYVSAPGKSLSSQGSSEKELLQSSKARYKVIAVKESVMVGHNPRPVIYLEEL